MTPITTLQKKEYMMDIKLLFFNLGMFIIRLGVGIIFIKSGIGKLFAGKDTLISIGKNMELIGIHAYPLFWGMCAMFSELIGGPLLVIGCLVRPAALVLSFTMFIAILHHFHAGDDLQSILYPLSYFLICLGILFAGPGEYIFFKCW
jgi:putative oxidoreductase